MDVHDIVAGGNAAAVGDLVVFVGGVAFHAKIVAQQVEYLVALIPEPDWRRVRAHDPQIDIVGHVAWPVHFDDKIAGRPVVLRFDRRFLEMRQQQDHHRHEADQGQHDDVAEDRPRRIFVEIVKVVHGALRV